jgi:hypothetical protein
MQTPLRLDGYYHNGSRLIEVVEFMQDTHVRYRDSADDSEVLSPVKTFQEEFTFIMQGHPEKPAL